MEIVLVLIVSGALFYLVMAGLGVARDLRGGPGAAARARLREALSTDEAPPSPSPVKERRLSGLPWLVRLMDRWRFTAGLEKLHRRSGVPTPLSVFLLLSSVLFLLATWAGSLSSMGLVTGLAAGLVLALCPLVALKRLKDRRMAAFERQLPDALDLVAQCLKAGHTMSGGMSVVAEEMDEPAASEFRTVVDELSFGASPREALAGLVSRIESRDLSFFVVAVNIQSESGGNLAGIVESIARLIRDRFRFRRRVRSLTAEGRTSAVVLALLPLVIVGANFLLNPEYARIMINPGPGRSLSLVTLALMSIGILIIRRLVNIKA